MDRKTMEDMCAAYTAALAGKKVEFRHSGVLTWSPIGDIQAPYTLEFRVTEKPLECWCVAGPTGIEWMLFTESEAISAAATADSSFPEYAPHRVVYLTEPKS